MRALLVILALIWPGFVMAQGGPAYLVADRIFLQDDGVLIAEGAVEVLQGEVRMTASRVVYDRTGDQLVITGPLRLDDGDGLVLIADQAELSQDFRRGLLTGVRMIMDDQLQLAAADARRTEEGLTQLRRVVASSCQICEPGQAPVWEIRARNVLHDQDAQQLYFEDAELRILDVPVAYLPRLRLPDPTLRRARGFLIPELESSTLLGLGIKVPYFIPMGDHADLTLTPYVSPVTSTLQMRLRRAFANGDLEAHAAVSADSLEDDTRAYLQAEGRFDLKRDYQLSFDLELVSDSSYLSDYDFSGTDRLESALELSRVRDGEYTLAALTHYESLRDSESNATQPTILSVLEHRRTAGGPGGIGQLRYGAMATGYYRTSDDDGDGRDLWRLHADAAWLGQQTFGPGLQLGWTLGVGADRISTDQDTSVPALVTQVTPSAALTLRWPLLRQGPSGAHQLLEPVAQVGWTGGTRTDHISDESVIQEFDEGNLLALSRFPASDRSERGLQGVAGMRWGRYDPNGWSANVTFGRLWRQEADDAFTEASGLRGSRSDWLVSTQIQTASGLTLGARGLFDTATSANSAEARAAWTGEAFALDATYVLEIADDAENRPDTQSEWNISGHYDVNRNWTASTNWRYDLAADELALAGLGLDYRNECIDVGFSVSRRFASSSTVEPSTRLGLTVTLKGFSTGGQAAPDLRTCRP